MDSILRISLGDAISETYRGRKMKKLLVYILILFSVPLFAADAVTVSNTVVSRANSGGNTAEEGEVIEGKSVSEVTVHTTIDGKTVEDIHETATGTQAKVEVRTEVNNGGTNSTSTGTAKIEIVTEKSTDSPKKTVIAVARGSTTEQNIASALESVATTTAQEMANEKATALQHFTLKSFISTVWKKIKYVFSFNWV